MAAVNVKKFSKLHLCDVYKRQAMQSANGLMSAADKTKLEGMPASGVYGEEF